MLVCLKSAESFYEPSALTLARSNNRCGFERPYSGRRSGAALRRGLRARPPPDPSTDIFKLGKTLTFVFCVDTAAAPRRQRRPNTALPRLFFTAY